MSASHNEGQTALSCDAASNLIGAEIIAIMSNG
jgi:YD repeat-containing protein